MTVRLITSFITALMLFSLSGCDDPKTSGTAVTPLIGTRILIKQHSYEIIGEVVFAENNLVGIDYYWHGEKAYSQKLYRGLISVWSQEQDSQRELDLDTAAVDQLFPLKVGKETSLSGIMTNLTTGEAAKMGLTLEVIKKTSAYLNGEDTDIFIIDMTRLIEGRPTTFETLYYAPAYGLVIKAVQKSGEGQSFWRVLEIEAPTTRSKRNIQKQNRRPGTIAI